MRQPRCSHPSPPFLLSSAFATVPPYNRAPPFLCSIPSRPLLSDFDLLSALCFCAFVLFVFFWFFLCIIGLLLSNSFFFFFVSYARTHVISLLFFVCFLFYCFIFSASSARRALFGRRVCQWGWVVSIVEEVEIEIESESVFCLVRVISRTLRCRCEALERGHQLAIIRIYK